MHSSIPSFVVEIVVFWFSCCSSSDVHDTKSSFHKNLEDLRKESDASVSIVTTAAAEEPDKVLADPMCSTASIWVSERKHYDVFSRRSVHILTRLSPPLNSICLSLRIGAKSKSWATLAARMIMVLKPFYRK
jgi:hypothetical protein